MKILKDKILILLLITSLGIFYLMNSRGIWETTIKQKGAAEDNWIKLSDNLSFESEHFINADSQIVGSHTYLVVANDCFTIDSLSVQIVELVNGKRIKLSNTGTKIADMQQLEFDSYGMIVPESLLKSHKITICPNQRIEVSNWFKYTQAASEDFEIDYYLKGRNQKPLSATVKLKKVESFRLEGRHHYDFIILLYPILWFIFGVLVITKIVLLIKKKRKPNKVYSA
ncbi:hypothetical protein [Rufibacter tibetensis]|uniref:Uncharacterized protein n=1 Tax=Rufibacter tibetensis TaxID=512763 RepID=A0A0P0C9W8_9BACT|nr:hypothetical protein [Rufibacter tibetensis]ALJ00406.1 hypothetical protein DC20_17295 [Rufibacter tibetensis]